MYIYIYRLAEDSDEEQETEKVVSPETNIMLEINFNSQMLKTSIPERY